MALTRIELKFRYPKPKPNPFRYQAPRFHAASDLTRRWSQWAGVLVFYLFVIWSIMWHGGAVTQQFGSCNFTPHRVFYNTKTHEHKGSLKRKLLWARHAERKISLPHLILQEKSKTWPSKNHKPPKILDFYLSYRYTTHGTNNAGDLLPFSVRHQLSTVKLSNK